LDAFCFRKLKATAAIEERLGGYVTEVSGPGVDVGFSGDLSNSVNSTHHALLHKGSFEIRTYGDAANSVPAELHNAEVEPICRRYLELRYRLIP
jgi:hypothetical protein